ncbi:MAG TPA: hypothetical protein VGV37_00520, partial [Aliidongia sp.]|uniref:hypothetical protein n=1 Tax=Aliidongia sp. TaxID=1914230 RepID=UPI002DDD7C65
MPNPIKRGNSWQVKIRRKGRDGILEKVNETFDTHAEAQRFIELKLGASARHERMSRDKEANTSLRMLLDRYEQEVVDPKPAKPRAQQRSIMTKWRNSGLADHSLLALEPELFGRWRDKQTKAGAAGSTVAN